MKLNPETHPSPSNVGQQKSMVDNQQGTVGSLRRFGGGAAANEAANSDSFARKIKGSGTKFIKQGFIDRLESFNMTDDEIVILAKLLRSYSKDESLGFFVHELPDGSFRININAFKSVSKIFLSENVLHNKITQVSSKAASALFKCGALKNSGISSEIEFYELIGSDLEYKNLPIENPPESLQDLINGVEVKSPTIYVNSLMDSITLPDGTVTNRQEIATVRYLNEIGVKRDNSGKLVYISGPKTGKQFVVESNFNPLMTLAKKLREQRDSEDSQVDSSMVTMIPRFLSNLQKNNIIQPEDFNISATKTNYTYISKRVDEKTNQMMLPSQAGELTALYYIGRKTFTGTSQEIDHESAVIRILDNKTAGIFQKSGLDDSLHLLFTFPLVSDELVKKQHETRKDRIEVVGNKRNIAFVGAKEMKVTPYKEPVDSDAVFNMRFDLLKLGVYSTNLAWEEQVRLYKALASGGGRAERIKKFIKEFGGDGLKAFLSYEKNSQVSRIIYELSEKNLELAHVIFNKIAQIIDQINNIDLFLENNFGKENHSEEIRAQVRGLLLGKATSVLETVSGDLYSESEVIEKLETINTQTLLFASSFKSLIESGFDISLEDIANAELVTHTGATLSREDYGIMFDMYKKNQGANSPINQELILKSFSKAAENPKARFHIFKWNNKLQGFVVFQDDENGFSKGSAFNVDPETHGYKIGDAILNQVIKKEAEVRPLIADVLAMNTIVPKYLDIGWVATRFFIDNNDPVLDIVQDSKSNEMYWGKSATPEAVLSLTAPQKVGRSEVVIEIASSQKDLIERYKNHFEKGLCLTRIVKNKSGDMYYGVFEPFIKPKLEIKQESGATDEGIIEE